MTSASDTVKMVEELVEQLRPSALMVSKLSAEMAGEFALSLLECWPEDYELSKSDLVSLTTTFLGGVKLGENAVK